MKADACANAVFDKDAKRFWHEVYKLSNVKATTNVSTIAGKVGNRHIAAMWKQYYEQLYCAKYDNVTMSAFIDKLTSFFCLSLRFFCVLYLFLWTSCV